MLKKNVKKIIVCIVFLAILALTIKTTLATDNNVDLYNQLTSLNGNEKIQEGAKEGSQIPAASNSNNALNSAGNNSNTNTNTNTNNNVANNKPATTPYTGIEDNSSIVFIVIFIAAAVYGYIKVKKYDF